MAWCRQVFRGAEHMGLHTALSHSSPSCATHTHAVTCTFIHTRWDTLGCTVTDTCTHSGAHSYTRTQVHTQKLLSPVKQGHQSYRQASSSLLCLSLCTDVILPCLALPYLHSCGFSLGPTISRTQSSPSQPSRLSQEDIFPFSAGLSCLCLLPTLGNYSRTRAVFPL